MLPSHPRIRPIRYFIGLVPPCPHAALTALSPRIAYTSFPSWSTTCGFRGVNWFQLSLLRWLENSRWPAWFSLDKSAFQRTLALFGQSPLFSTGSQRIGGLYIFWIRCCTAPASLSNGNLCQGWCVCVFVCVQSRCESAPFVLRWTCFRCSLLLLQRYFIRKGPHDFHLYELCSVFSTFIFLHSCQPAGDVMWKVYDMCMSLTLGVTSKGKLCSFGEEIQTDHFDICNVNDEVIIHTFLSISE